jgi:hypothetical protein
VSDRDRENDTDALGDDSPANPNASPSAIHRRRLRDRVRLPMVSGSGSALVLAMCLVVAALVIVPLAWHLPRWVDAEIVVAVWWLLWIAALAILLHGGQPISDDHEWRPARSWFGNSGRASDTSDGCFWSLADFGGVDLGASAGEACATIVVVLLTIVALFIAAWFVIEVAIPGIAFVTYLLLRGMLARVVNDRHGCAGSWPKAIGWAVVWATLYILPQAALVWVIHLVVQKSKLN